ncbi:glycosyltransferase family 4 protein [Candidatus Raskinella chloraquaticus]|uniref:Alpha-mannosyltransferase n=1 Tax=Candidatus Raskinella chloraquaticus TaxID=1951219 RepID=A0A1W9HRI1_9HYPH|nr:MAG: alpha-mannosyltransferase [Proteobacteria bacterium SG_bin8]
MRVLVATDAWHPQVNGVVRSLEALVREAPGLGAQVEVLSPLAFRTLPMPGYSEIRLAIAPLLRPSTIGRHIQAIDPDYIHIATEGPIGNATRNWCLKNGRAFTTSYHTKFPEYVSARLPVPQRWTYTWLRRFHNSGAGVMVATQSLEADLARRGFVNIMRWGRGVDTQLFKPRAEELPNVKHPVFLYVGRVSVEKNLPAFLSLDLPGTKLVVGEGPILNELRVRFPDVVFLGKLENEELAEAYAGSDVFVFPSRTDTFGIVLLEAMASGLTVAAYPVTGPADVVQHGVTGSLSEDLRAACLEALALPREACRNAALAHSWQQATKQFLDNVREANTVKRRRRFLPLRLRRKARS